MTTSSSAVQPSREARFRAVYEATYDDLLRFAQRRVDLSHAEDVAADVFLVAWRRLDDMPDEVADARPWLFGVARATILNHRRGSRRRDALAVRLADAALTGDLHPGDDLAASRLDLAAAWAQLSDADQEAISLVVWEGLSSAQAGVVLGCSATAYRIRLSRARRSLRQHLEAATRSDSSVPPSAMTPEGPQR
ncbi:RNA polymerase sigma factor [Nocardioides mesophilus]|uniref:RNA polymerase sigma factor n=1 Tax=Nocardioides mesophilus TaxID=433659 RepID=A0A7G9RFN4_9ACTN|nr:RNA polymerase sigma factor [Nocardioides mesophilus]QNN54409.1 RNA polymerase sigma factor [Nocardioides mesophilus]